MIMTSFEIKRHIEIDVSYQGINLTEFIITADEHVTTDQIVETFIRSKQFSFDSLRDCAKAEPDKEYLRQAFKVEKLKIDDFKKKK
jgi:hypothetical protein